MEKIAKNNEKTPKITKKRLKASELFDKNELDKIREILQIFNGTVVKIYEIKNPIDQKIVDFL